MSRLSRRPRVSHEQTARALRQRPGVWLVVGDYRTSSSSDAVCHIIRTAYRDSGVWYQPAGAFETRTALVEDGVRVEARYIGEAR